MTLILYTLLLYPEKIAKASLKIPLFPSIDHRSASQENF